MFLIFRVLHSNVLDNKCQKQKWCMVFYAHMKLVAHVLVCVCVCVCVPNSMHQMKKPEVSEFAP